MSSAQLVALRNNIAGNTLTALEQAILTTALDEIAPTFPSPDELANSIPQPEEALARTWMCALYAIQAEEAPPMPPTDVTDVTATSPLVATSPTAATRNIALLILQSAMAVNAGVVNLTASAQVSASATITPRVTGKVRVIITGTVDNNDSSTTSHPIVLTVSTGAGPTPVAQTSGTMRAAQAGSSNGTTTVALVVDLDRATTPVTGTVGTPIQVNACLTGDATGHLSVGAGNLQIAIQERFE
jgi:hypothetical protein